MTYTCRDVIRLAQKKQGVIRAGGEPTAADASDMLESLKSFYKELITQGAFGQVRSVIASTDVTAGVGQHIANTGATPIVVTLPLMDEWWWFEPTTPADLSVVVSTDLTDVRLTHLYDAQIQRWIDLETMTLDTEAPLSSRGYDGLASVLAVRTSDLFGDSLMNIQTVKSANSFKLALVSRHGVLDQEQLPPRFWDYGFPQNYWSY